MPEDPRAPPFPAIRLEILEDLSPDTGPGFVQLVRRKLRASYPDATSSEPFVYDEVDRRAMDAVVIAAHYPSPEGRHVLLRSSIRPPVYFRRPDPLGRTTTQLWELPAGLLEIGEDGADGVRRAALRELLEETGASPPAERLCELGPSLYACPGVIGEKLFFFEVEVDPAARSAPPLDGSALEHFGAVIDVSLVKALDWCKTGTIEDVKTEIGLRRLAERFS